MSFSLAPDSIAAHILALEQLTVSKQLSKGWRKASLQASEAALNSYFRHLSAGLGSASSQETSAAVAALFTVGEVSHQLPTEHADSLVCYIHKDAHVFFDLSTRTKLFPLDGRHYGCSYLHVLYVQVAVLEDPKVGANLVTLLRALAVESVTSTASQGAIQQLPVPPSVQVTPALGNEPADGETMEIGL